jgi:hypothetical protein
MRTRSAISEDPRLHRLDAAPRLGRQDDDGEVGRAGDLDFRLSHADRLDEDAGRARGVEDVRRVLRGARQPARRAARRHRSHEDARVLRRLGHPDAVAEQGAAGEGARRIDGDDADALAAGAEDLDEGVDGRGLPAPRRSREAEPDRAAHEGGDGVEEGPALGRPVLRGRDGPADGERVPFLYAFKKIPPFALFPALPVSSCGATGGKHFVIVARPFSLV